MNDNNYLFTFKLKSLLEIDKFKGIPFKFTHIIVYKKTIYRAQLCKIVEYSFKFEYMNKYKIQSTLIAYNK